MEAKNTTIIPFEKRFMKEAARLLQNTQKGQFKALNIPYQAESNLCETIITNLLAKKETLALLLINQNQVAGYLIGEITRDEIWGDRGQVSLGGIAMDSAHWDSFPLLYREVGRHWADCSIVKHTINTFDYDRQGSENLNNMGFARQQTYAILDLAQINPEPSDPSLICRRAGLEDQSAIKMFSRLIAEYQTQSPCFAPAPEDYLKALDKGFSTLIGDEEMDVYVAHAAEGEDQALMAYQAYYPLDEPDLLTPRNSTELSVAGVKENHRGRGTGRELTAYCLNQQKKQGYKYVLTDWRTANIFSGPFWKKNGFMPAARRFYRQIETI